MVARFTTTLPVIMDRGRHDTVKLRSEQGRGGGGGGGGEEEDALLGRSL